MPTYFNYITLEDEDIQFALDMYLIQVGSDQYRFKAVPEFSEYISEDAVSRVKQYWVINSEILVYLKNNQNFNWDRCYSAAEVRLIMEGTPVSKSTFGMIPAYIYHGSYAHLLWMLEHAEIDKRFILLKMMEQVTSTNEVIRDQSLAFYRKNEKVLDLLSSCLQENSVASIIRTVNLLAAIADHHISSCEKIYNTDIIKQAIELSNHTSPLVQKAILNFFQTLTTTHKKSCLHLSVKEIDAISRLLIKSKDDLLNEWALLTFNLLLHAKKSYLSLHNAGIIPLLLGLLQKNDAEITLNGMLILTNFAQYEYCHQTLFEANVIECGINYLNGATSNPIKEESVFLLSQISSAHKPSYDRCCSILKVDQCVGYFNQFSLKMRPYITKLLVNLAFNHYRKSQEIVDDKFFLNQLKLWQDANVKYGCVEQSLGISLENETTILDTIISEIQRVVDTKQRMGLKRRNDFFQEVEFSLIDDVVLKRAKMQP